MPFATHAEIIETVEDIYGQTWYCTDKQETEHGFLIWHGRCPTHSHGGRSVVLTPELVIHLDTHHFDPSSAKVPLNDKVISRIHRALISSNFLTTDTIIDINGDRFKAYLAYPCDLGIKIYQGINLSKPYAKPTFVLTPDLASLIREWANFPNQFLAYMPFELNILKKHRRRLGIPWDDDNILRWSKLADELFDLNTRNYEREKDRSASLLSCMRTSIKCIEYMLKNPKKPTIEQE